MDGHQPESHRSEESSPLREWEFIDVSPAATRRGFVKLGVGLGLSALLSGCSSQPSSDTASLPGPVWKPRTLPPDPSTPMPLPHTPSAGGPPNVIPRSAWSGGDPVPSMMDRMTTVTWITVHHDGMDPFYATDEGSSKARLESIRRAHRAKGWGDIGYHYVVDRSGRVWEARPIVWQGAHVKDCNPGNIGVMCMGNFDRETPSQAQLAALNRHVTWLMKNYRVPTSKLRTHQEWPSAATACPGVNLQRYMVAVRQNKQIGQA